MYVGTDRNAQIRANTDNYLQTYSYRDNHTDTCIQTHSCRPIHTDRNMYTHANTQR